MKIKVKDVPYDKARTITPAPHEKPKHQSRFFRKLIPLLSAGDLKKVNFSCEKVDMDRLGKHEPALFLMNHSCFLDLEIAGTLLADREYHILCTNDGFVGKKKMMEMIGCIPTKKFISDLVMIRDMQHCIKKLNSSLLMYPEASYSFDGTETPLPASLGKCLKLLKVPVVMIRTYGAFGRDPLYNGLRVRKTDVHATMTYLFSPEDIENASVDELNAALAEVFRYDHFRWQYENKISISEDFRAEQLERVLYQCPVCNTEGKMEGHGIEIRCNHCESRWELTEHGALEGPQTAFSENGLAFIPDWYAWEREQVRQALLEENYKIELPVTVRMLIDFASIYTVGEGILKHSKDGFVLEGCDGALCYEQKPKTSYSLYSDYFWYELGDMVSIGDTKYQYYCFPKDPAFPVAKMRLAAEELYKIVMKKNGQPA